MEENVQQVTLIDALKTTANLLGNIAVPRKFNDQIGIPIDKAIGNIHACINFLISESEQANNKGPENEEQSCSEQDSNEQEAEQETAE